MIQLVPLHPLSHARLIGILVSLTVCLALAWVTVLARYWTRLRLIRGAGLDDLFIGMALVRLVPP